MPVDKSERNGDRATTVYTGIIIDILTNSFLKIDGGNAAIGAIVIVATATPWGTSGDPWGFTISLGTPALSRPSLGSSWCYYVRSPVTDRLS